MKIGLYDVDSHNFPNLALMKISAWHKKQGDDVEFMLPLMHYDKVYVSKVFGDEYSQMPNFCIQADEVIYGGTGFAITIENGKEVYHKDRDKNLPYEIEHILCQVLLHYRQCLGQQCPRQRGGQRQRRQLWRHLPQECFR